jgi:hypothetical protein
MRLPDFLVLAGIAGIGYGCWLVHPSLTFISVGAAAVYFGIYLHRKPAKAKE